MDEILRTPTLDREMRSIRGLAFHFSGARSSSTTRDSTMTSGTSHPEKVTNMVDDGMNEPVAANSASRLKICASVLTRVPSWIGWEKIDELCVLDAVEVGGTHPES